MAERQIPAAVASAGWRVIASPFQFVTTGEERFELRVWSYTAGHFLTLSGRWLKTDGAIQVFRQDFLISTTTGGQKFAVNVGAGALLNCTLQMNSPATTGTRSFVQLALVRGTGASAVDVGVLLQGPIQLGAALSYPGSPIVSPYEGHGRLGALTAGIAPAAGADILISSPFPRAIVRGFVATLTTSAAAGARLTELLLSSGGALVARCPVNVGLAPSQAVTFSWWAGVWREPGWINPIVQAAMPADLVLEGNGSQIATFTQGLAVGDTWTGLTLYLEEWLTPFPIF